MSALRLVCLLSSGIDSPVAAFVMASRGAEMLLLHLDNWGPCDTRTLEVVKTIAIILREATGQEMPLLVAPFHLIQDRIAESCQRGYHCVMCKRYMLRVARELAVRTGAEAIVTGDSLGQVASQTLQNILVEQKGLDLPVLRPLIGLDKLEIEAVAREVGTYGRSTTQLPGCRYLPQRPRTSSSEEAVEAQEARLESGAILGEVMSRVQRISP